MKDIEELCNKLMVINKGKIVYDGPLDFPAEESDIEHTVMALLDEAVPRLKER